MKQVIFASRHPGCLLGDGREVVVDKTNTSHHSWNLGFTKPYSRLFVRDIGELADLGLFRKKAGLDYIESLIAKGNIPESWKEYVTIFTGTKVLNLKELECEYPALFWNGQKWCWRWVPISLNIWRSICYWKVDKNQFETEKFRLAYQKRFLMRRQAAADWLQAKREARFREIMGFGLEDQYRTSSF
jgi:hypothetical protein